jgi:hypothetical protein
LGKKESGRKKKPSCLTFKKTIAIMFESSNIWSTNESIELLYQAWTLALQFEFYDIIVLNFHELAISVCLIPFPFHDTIFLLWWNSFIGLIASLVNDYATFLFTSKSIIGCVRPSCHSDEAS